MVHHVDQTNELLKKFVPLGVPLGRYFIGKIFLVLKIPN